MNCEYVFFKLFAFRRYSMFNHDLCKRTIYLIWLPWVFFCLTALPDRRLSSLRVASCSCPEVLGPPDCCKVKEVSLHLRGQDESLGQHQIQAPKLGLPGEAEGLGEEGDQTGTGIGGGTIDHRQFVEQP